MKKGILFLLVISAVSANAQSLKEALYGGKLKNDSSTVIRKTDDLSTKIDTSRKKSVEQEKVKQTTVVPDASINNMNVTTEAAIIAAAEQKNNNFSTKDNNKLWKEFVDTVTNTLKQEVMPSKKINKGDYYITVDYTIAPDGVVTIANLLLIPENKFLEQQVKERLSIDTPRLNPVLATNGTPRKVNKRYNFNISK